MATTIITPAQSNNSSNTWMPFLIGIVALILFVALCIFFALPYIRGLTGNGGVQINVPKTIDVKVQHK